MMKFFQASAFSRPGERLRASVGAFFGILVLGLAGAFVHHRFQVPLMLIAPMGASAVLLFALPSSPLAQPWSVIGGNLLASGVGLVMTLHVPSGALAAALAVGISIGLMASLRCLHPPSGAVALTVVLTAPKTLEAGLSFIAWPVLANSLLIVLAATLFHTLTGHSYPEFLKRADKGAGVGATSPTARVEAGIIEDVLATSDEILDISPGDVSEIYRKINVRMEAARHDALACKDIMDLPPEAISPGAPLWKAYDEIVRRPAHAVFVTDENARVVGLLTLMDLATKANITPETIRVSARQRLKNASQLRAAPSHVVEDIMRRNPMVVTSADPASKALVALLESGWPMLPVVNKDQQLVGAITQEHIIAALVRRGRTMAPAG